MHWIFFLINAFAAATYQKPTNGYFDPKYLARELFHHICRKTASTDYLSLRITCRALYESDALCMEQDFPMISHYWKEDRIAIRVHSLAVDHSKLEALAAHVLVRHIEFDSVEIFLGISLHRNSNFTLRTSSSSSPGTYSMSHFLPKILVVNVSHSRDILALTSMYSNASSMSLQIKVLITDNFERRNVEAFILALMNHNIKTLHFVFKEGTLFLPLWTELIKNNLHFMKEFTIQFKGYSIETYGEFLRKQVSRFILQMPKLEKLKISSRLWNMFPEEDRSLILISNMPWSRAFLSDMLKNLHSLSDNFHEYSNICASMELSSQMKNAIDNLPHHKIFRKVTASVCSINSGLAKVRTKKLCVIDILPDDTLEFFQAIASPFLESLKISTFYYEMDFLVFPNLKKLSINLFYNDLLIRNDSLLEPIFSLIEESKKLRILKLKFNAAFVDSVDFISQFIENLKLSVSRSEKYLDSIQISIGGEVFNSTTENDSDYWKYLLR